MNKEPLVSVIMGVYNTKIEYLRIAMDSILHQTYRNLEFIIIDDASDQWCAAFLEEYKNKRETEYGDRRIRLFHNERNKGLTVSLNIALRMAKGNYIARMDADDISLPQRISKQISYMEAHKDIDVLACGSFIYGGEPLFPTEKDFTDSPRFAGIYRKFEQERMRVRLSFANIEFTHPTVVFRSSFLRENHLQYDESIHKAQDYNMWVRCIEKGKLDSLQEVLFISREFGERIGNHELKGQTSFADVTKVMCLKRLLPQVNVSEEKLYIWMRDTKMSGSVTDNRKLIQRLVKANDLKKEYDLKVYRQEIFFWWMRKGLYRKNWPFGIRMLIAPYMFLNILRIGFPQTCRYGKDLIYKRKIKKRGAVEMTGYGEYRV